MVKKVILAEPRGFCAGVEMAIETVKLTHQKYPGCDVYVNHQIVHNEKVVNELIEDYGTIFVEDLDVVPEGGILVLSAHGVGPDVYEQARQRNLKVIDATCPLVDKVHKKAIRYDENKYEIILIGHEGHQEVIGHQGYAAMHVVDSIEDVEALQVTDPNKVAFITQTTLSVEDTREVVGALYTKFPNIKNSKDDICYATTNRQEAVKRLSEYVDLVLVAGESNSSNSVRLVETAMQKVPAYLISDVDHIDKTWLEGVETVGLTSGASVPESVVHGIVKYFTDKFHTTVETLLYKEEHVTFKLPSEVV